MHAAVRLKACLAADEASKAGNSQAQKLAKQMLKTATMEFKISIAALGAIVRHQTAEIMMLKGVSLAKLPSAALVHAKACKVTNAELRRLIHIANVKYQTSKKKAATSGKAALLKTVLDMAVKFESRLNAIRAKMSRADSAAGKRLGIATIALYRAFAFKRSTKSKKQVFNRELKLMVTKAAQTAMKYSRSIARLTGLTGNLAYRKAIKSAQGRMLLRLQVQANNANAEAAVMAPVRAGLQAGLAGLPLGKSKKAAKARNAKHLGACAGVELLLQSFMRQLKSQFRTSSLASSQKNQEINFGLKLAGAFSSRNLAAAVLAAVKAPNAVAPALLQTTVSAKLSVWEALQQAITARARLHVTQQMYKAAPNPFKGRKQIGDGAALLSADIQGTFGALNKAKNGAAFKHRLKSVHKSAQKASKSAAAIYTKPFLRIAARQAKAAKVFLAVALQHGRQELLSAAIAKAKRTKNKAATKKPKSVASVPAEVFSWPSAQVLTQKNAKSKAPSLPLAAVTFLYTTSRFAARAHGEVAVLTGAATRGGIRKRVIKNVKFVLRWAYHKLVRWRHAAMRTLTIKERKVAIKKMIRRVAKTTRSAARLHKWLRKKWRSAAGVTRAEARKSYAKGMRPLVAVANGLLPVGDDASVDAKLGAESALVTLSNSIIAAAPDFVKGWRRLKILPKVSKGAHLSQSHATAAILKDILHSEVLVALQLGEAQAKQKDDTDSTRWSVRKNGSPHHYALQQAVSRKIEDRADVWFGNLDHTRRTIAKNYLQLLAYTSVTPKLSRSAMVVGHTGLLSLGDLLLTVQKRQMKPIVQVGVGMGSDTATPMFGASSRQIHDAVGRINEVLRDYTQVFRVLRARWRLGVGRYVLGKVEAAMMRQGVLRVEHQLGKDPTVAMNSMAIGLQDQLSTFKKYAVPMPTFKVAHAKMQSMLSISTLRGKLEMHGPEWQGH